MTTVVESAMVLGMATDNLIGTAEAAERIGVERSTLSHWIAKGRIVPALKLPGKTGATLFDRDEVDRVAKDYAESLTAAK